MRKSVFVLEYKKSCYSHRHTWEGSMKRDVNRQKRTIKRAARVLAVLTGACLVMLLGGCGKKEKEPVTVTL